MVGIDGTDDGMVHRYSRAQWNRRDDVEFLPTVLPHDDGIAIGFRHHGSFLATTSGGGDHDCLDLWHRHIGWAHLPGGVASQRRSAIDWPIAKANCGPNLDITLSVP